MFDYELPEELIALRPATKREDAKMMVYDACMREVHHSGVRSLTEYLRGGDLLVLNTARVAHARLSWSWKGKLQEVLFLRCINDQNKSSVWEAIVSGKKIPLGQECVLNENTAFKILKRVEGGLSVIEVNRTQSELENIFQVHGHVPIPPYIRKRRIQEGLLQDDKMDEDRYQTVFADKSGAVAAPTAGLHLTTEIMNDLETKGVTIASAYLQVGWGTFQPLTEHHWVNGKLHEEYVEVKKEAAEKILNALDDGRRIIAIGTTSVRAIEWWACHGKPAGGLSGSCDLFLRPPWRSNIFSGMLTNFHLPGSSLLALVSAFLGDDGERTLKNLYLEAIEKKYRFYSYGDCMLIV